MQTGSGFEIGGFRVLITKNPGTRFGFRVLKTPNSSLKIDLFMTDTLHFKIQSIEVKLVMLCFYYELEIFGKISWKVFLILAIQSCLGLVEQFFIISTTKIVKKWNKIGMK